MRFRYYTANVPDGRCPVHGDYDTGISGRAPRIIAARLRGHVKYPPVIQHEKKVSFWII